MSLIFFWGFDDDCVKANERERGGGGGISVTYSLMRWLALSVFENFMWSDEFVGNGMLMKPYHFSRPQD